MGEERAFRGIWIPRDVYFDTRLSPLDKIILMEIDSLDNDGGCFATNEYLASFCQCSERKVSESISKLKDAGYIEVDSFDGRKRFLRSRVAKSARQGSKNCEADQQNLRGYYNRSNNIDNSIDDMADNGSASQDWRESAFEEFWSAYPRKVAKQKAKKSFSRIKREDFARLMESLEQQKLSKQWTKDNGEFIPHPTTWLNQERWLDELTLFSDDKREVKDQRYDENGYLRVSY